MTLQVLLIRHSHAVPEGSGLSDEHRYLSERGRNTARRVGATLRSEGVRADVWLTSPLPRAVQTAELLANALEFTGEIVVLPPLQPGCAPEFVAMRLSQHVGTVALVGHEPTLSGLGALLVSRPSFPPFRPCQVSLIDGGLPLWTLSPDTLAREPLLIA